MTPEVALVFATLVASPIGVGFVRRWCERRQVVAIPNERSSHTRPIAIGGGLPIAILTLLALIVFRVPIKGSFLMLALCTILYVTATTGIGMVTSTFTSSQVAAVFVTAILTITPTIQFSGLLQPVSTLKGNAGRVGSIWPASYYMHTSLGAYTKGLGINLMVGDIIFMLCAIPVLLAISYVGLRKQER